MATHPATLEQPSASSISATVLKFTPILLAAVLAAGCSTKAQRIGSLSGDPSMAATANSKGRGVPDASQPATASSLTASQGGKSSTEAGTENGSTPGAGGSSDDPGSNQADASSSSDEAAASSSSDSVGGVGSTARDGAGGDQAATMSGGAKGASRRPGTAGRTGAATASGSQGTPGSAATDSDASSVSGSSAKANGSSAKANQPRPGTAGASDTNAGASDTNAGASDLSSGGSVAALEGSAAGVPGGKTGTAAGGRGTTTTLGSGGDGTDTGGAAAAGLEGDSRIAAIDVPSGQVKVDEEYRPQTLGGVLPLILGVNEEGRFDFDQYSLRPEVKRILDQLTEQLKTAEYDRLDIVGYTDRIGTSDYNRRLSELRAYAVAQYLVAKGVPENKIRYEGRGDKDPLTPAGHCQGLAREELITCLQKDRRVVIEASIHRKHATVIQ